MSSEGNKRLAEHIEERRAEARDAAHAPEGEWYDIIDGGEKIEVKTCPKTVQNPSGSRTGRYQLVGDNHEQLVESGGKYDFVLRNSDNEIIDVQTMKAQEVDEVLVQNDREWPVGSKLKVLWTKINSGVQR